MKKQAVQILTSSRTRKKIYITKSVKGIQNGNYFWKLIKTRPDLDYPAWQLQLKGKYDTIVYLRKKETDKLKYYLIVDRYLFLNLDTVAQFIWEKEEIN